jgi:hypothetical protein
MPKGGLYIGHGAQTEIIVRVLFGFIRNYWDYGSDYGYLEKNGPDSAKILNRGANKERWLPIIIYP